jgi:hypothetical protein
LIALEGSQVRFDSWSPNSLWIAYWLTENETSPTTLAFTHIISGETCQAEEVQAQSFGDGHVIWQKDGSIIALPGGFTAGEMLRGTPCGMFVPANDEILPNPRTRTNLSSDGRYLAEAVIGQTVEEVFPIELRITEFATGQLLFAMSYLGSPHLIFGGPRWLNNDIYVIGRTFDQGVLYYSVVEDRIGQLYPDLLGLESEKDFSFFTQTDPQTGVFHILLLSDGPPLLYHSEFDQLEELPFANVGNFADASGGFSLFSHDGKYLLLSQVTGGHYWLRPVDPPGSPSTQLDYYGVVGGLSPDGQKLAYLHGKSITITHFPSGEVLAQWHASIHDIQNIWWSPDSNRLIALGHQSETNQTVLFVIEP